MIHGYSPILSVYVETDELIGVFTHSSLLYVSFMWGVSV